MDKIKKTLINILHDPATFIALGSVFMSIAMGGIEGAYLNILAVLGIAGLKAYEVWTEREIGRPFAALAFVNFGTAASIGCNAIYDFGFGPDIFPHLAVAVAYVFSGVRSTLLAAHQWRGSEPKSFIDDPQFYEGLCALALARGVLILSFFSVAGIFRTFMNGKLLKDKDNEKEPSFFMRHFTAARAYSLQYALGGLMVVSFSLYEALALFLWAWAFSRFNLDLNGELRMSAVKKKII